MSSSGSDVGEFSRVRIVIEAEQMIVYAAHTSWYRIQHLDLKLLMGASR